MPREPLETIVLVGGQGTRLRPLTLSAPKPLLPTAGVPFLAHLLARAAAGGVTHVVLATCYKADMFAACFGDGSAFGLEIAYVQEDVPLDTGGGIRNAAASLRGSGPGDPVVVFNSDVLSGHDLGAQVDLHGKTDAAVTLHLVEVDDPSRFGVVPTDDSGRVTAFLEKAPNPVTNAINAGCYVFRRDVIDQIPAGRRVSVERETFPGLIEAGQLVMGYHESAYWLDVGTPQTFVRGAGACRAAAPSAGCLGVRGCLRVRRDRRGVRGVGGRGGDGVRQRAVRLGDRGRGRRGARLDPRPRRGGGRGRRGRGFGDRGRGVHRIRQRAGPRHPGLARGPAGADLGPLLLRHLTALTAELAPSLDTAPDLDVAPSFDTAPGPDV